MTPEAQAYLDKASRALTKARVDLAAASSEPIMAEEIRVFMSGNFCRCTGYHAIIDAIETTMLERAKGHS